MKWLSLFKKKRSKVAVEDRPNRGSSSSDDDDDVHGPGISSPYKQVALGPTSLDQWYQARSRRTSFSGNETTTTQRLQVCKDGVTTLINRTYVVIKHLGTGTYGQVKLAFNLNDKKLYAIKACRKSQLGCPSLLQRGGNRLGRGRLKRHGTCRNTSTISMSTTVSISSLQQQPITVEPKPWGSSSELAGLDRTTSPLGSSMSTGCSSRQGAASISRSPSPLLVTTASAGQQQHQQGGLHVEKTYGSCDMEVVLQSLARVAQPEQPAAAASVQKEANQQLKAEDFVREIAIMKRLSHANIVKLVEVIDDPASDNLLLVMEYVEGESLQPRQLSATRWEPEQEVEAWRRARDVLQGLEYLHYHGVVHGDLKPANLIMDSNTRHVKIVDFGSAVLNSSRMGRSPASALGAGLSLMGPGTMSCTPAFRSPESLQLGYRLSFELDMWALGVTLYLWVTGELPFNGAAPFMVYENIRKQPVSIPTSIRISAELTDFLRGLLEKDPARRLDVAAARQHPWVTGGGEVPLVSMVWDTMDIPEEPLGEGSGGRQEAASEGMEGVALMNCDGDAMEPEAATKNAPPPEQGQQLGHGGSCNADLHGDCLVAVPELFELGPAATGCPTAAAQQRRRRSTDGFPPCTSLHTPVRAQSGRAVTAASAWIDAGSASDWHQGAQEQQQQQQQAEAARHVPGSRQQERRPSASKPPVCRKRGNMDGMFMDMLTQEELDHAISQCTLGGVEAIDRVFEEVHFGPRQQIISAGDPMAHVYLISQGEVEIYQEMPARSREGEDQAHCHLSSPIISGLDIEGRGPDAASYERDDSAPLDFLKADVSDHSGFLHTFNTGRPSCDSDRLSYDSSGHNGNASGLRHAAHRPSRLSQEQLPSSSPNALSDACRMEGFRHARLRQVVVAVKGPGDSLGLVSLEPRKQEPTWRANVRAKGAVMALRAEVRGLQRLVQQHPELASAVRNIAVQQQTDLRVAEALRQLRMVSMGQQQQLELRQMQADAPPSKPLPRVPV